jgi:hypothetical protein
MFNRHQLAMTRYMLLRKETPKDQLPSVVVLHARYGGCLGDVTNYRSFSNGGPYSLRGNNIGELASFSRFLEVQSPHQSIMFTFHNKFHKILQKSSHLNMTFFFSRLQGRCVSLCRSKWRLTASWTP